MCVPTDTKRHLVKTTLDTWGLGAASHTMHDSPTSIVDTPISKKVVGENGVWQLSNGDCTTKRNCGLKVNNQLSMVINDASSI